ncbi:putative rhamnosyl transferase [Cognatishimia activa]|uniref:Rhamnosyl transferase n=1 Tax=Cognatishimia activa TaxID=1715691 RepID=A0A0P1INW2_9RHOB|nr:putative rhamnosyl transferase [Cognatishimia activa]CUI26796.1 hypothetical protein TA5113_00028 [Cognatishimia activa]CUK25161.1 hypothetical protein TA5114_00951 [Cognatishimia activa]
MNSQDMQVIGLCRFSYPALGGFQVEHDSIEERRAYLYAPERMDDRMRTFETIALPGLKAQTDQNFEFLIVVGTCLPARYREQLEAMITDMPQAKIVAEDPAKHRPVMKKVINRHLRENSELPSLQFRHDDDDAVAVNFIERFRAAADDCSGLLAKSASVGIDFNRGFSARPTTHGMLSAPSFMPYYGVALGMAVAPFVDQTIMNYGHNKINQVMPTVTYTDEDMFIRGHNDFNDSRQKANVKRVNLQPLDKEGEAHFKLRFAIDSDQVRAAFG